MGFTLYVKWSSHAKRLRILGIQHPYRLHCVKNGTIYYLNLEPFGPLDETIRVYLSEKVLSRTLLESLNP